MRKLTSLLALCFLVSANALWAGEPDEASAKSETAESMLKKEKTSTSDDDSYKKFRFGGYGEMVASFKDYGINRFFGGNRGNSDDPVIRSPSRVSYWHSIISSIPSGYWGLK